MIIPHLIFAHLLADYILQTDWLVQRKGKFVIKEVHSWDGLLLHGLMVMLMSLAVLGPYIDRLWPYIVVMTIVHTIQDALKIWSGPRINIPPIFPYALDQLMHLVVISVFQALTAHLLVPPPGQLEITLMSLGAALIAVTRLYEVSWWANWFAIYPYMSRWRWWGYAERVTMLLLSGIGLWFVAPLAALPRVLYTRRNGDAIRTQKYGTVELLVGMAFAIILGFAL